MTYNSVIGNTTSYFPPTFTLEQYLYRNCLTGGVHVEFNVSAIVGMVGYYYGVSSADDDLILWRTFNNRVRQCPTNYTYYEPIAGQCYGICPLYYYVNSTYNLCLPCDHRCIQCTTVNSSNSCSQCSNLDERTLINGSCICNAGFYDNGISSLCGSCNYRCLTCSNGNSDSCLTCDNNLSRTMNLTTN